jgi:uncharacterized protein
MERANQGEFATIDLAAKDFDGQTAFYKALFDWTHTDLPTEKGPYRVFAKDGGAVAGAYPMAPDMIAAGVPSTWNTYVAVDDVDAAAEKALALGGQIAMPATDAAGYGRFAGVTDPTGATVFLWRSTAPDSSAVYKQPGALAWNDLSTWDPVAAAEFYKGLFGWDVEAMEGGPMAYWMITVGGEGQAGIMPMPETMPPEAVSNWLVYFGAENARTVTERAIALGGSAVVEPMDTAGMVWSVLTDPAGAMFAILQTATA